MRHGPLLTTIAVFVLIYVIGGQLYPAMQKPQVFFNLFINDASLLLVSIGMTFVILTGGIDLSVGGMVALTSTASAALLKAGVNPFIVMPLMIVHGHGLRRHDGQPHPLPQGPAVHRDVDGPVFRPRRGVSRSV